MRCDAVAGVGRGWGKGSHMCSTEHESLAWCATSMQLQICTTQTGNFEGSDVLLGSGIHVHSP